MKLKMWEKITLNVLFGIFTCLLIYGGSLPVILAIIFHKWAYSFIYLLLLIGMITWGICNVLKKRKELRISFLGAFIICGERLDMLFRVNATSKVSGIIEGTEIVITIFLWVLISFLATFMMTMPIAIVSAIQ